MSRRRLLAQRTRQPDNNNNNVTDADNHAQIDRQNTRCCRVVVVTRVLIMRGMLLLLLLALVWAGVAHAADLQSVSIRFGQFSPAGVRSRVVSLDHRAFAGLTRVCSAQSQAAASHSHLAAPR
jgi:hypothetical protein